MIFKVNKNELKAALESVSPACHKTAVPTTINVLCRVADGVLNAIGYDLEMGITATVPVEIPVTEMCSCKFMVDCGKFATIAAKLPDGNVEMNYTDNTLIIKSGRSKSTIPSLPADDFPTVPTSETNASFTINRGTLADMIRQTVFATATNENKPVLTGELFSFSGTKLEIAAMDGYRLAVRNSANTYSGDKFVVKANILKAVMKLCKDTDKDVTVYPTKKHIVFDFGTTQLFSRNLDGEFNDYNSILNKLSTSAEAIVPVRTMIETLERFLLLDTEKSTAAVICNFGNGKIEMSIKSQTGEMQDTVDCDFSGTPMCIGFNCRYFLDALKAPEADKVKFMLNSPLSPMIVRPVQGDEHTMLVLPMRIRN